MMDMLVNHYIGAGIKALPEINDILREMTQNLEVS